MALAILVRGLTKSVDTRHEFRLILLWHQQVRTDRTTPKNKLYIIIPDNEKETCLLIDTAFSGYTSRNMIKKEAEKILKYEDFTVEVQRMWNGKIKVIPVIIGATGCI